MTSQAVAGIARSLRIYHGDRAHAGRLDGLYSQFLRAGDLVFDIGAHVGDRVSSFRRLKARVVAVEPQPLAMRALRLIHGRDPGVVLLQAACAARRGRLGLHLNEANPTVSSASPAFLSAARDAPGWTGQSWSRSLEVPCIRLDDLVAAHGTPAFVKIDVEGFEAEVLGGLSHPLPALSFEFTTIQRAVALRCLERLDDLGRYGFNVALGENHRFVSADSLSAHDTARLLADLPASANSGDVYAVSAWH